MAILSGGVLSGSTDGEPIEITGTSSGGAVDLHVSPSGTTSWEEPWVYCYNSDTVDRTLTIGFGTAGTSNPQTFTIPAKQKLPIIQGIERFTNARKISAWASAANVLFVTGGFNRVG